jgi:Spy/CpxP family protein refolding chaperone
MFKRVLMAVVALTLPIAAVADDSPLAVVAHVLSLSEEQVQALAEFLQARHETLRPAAEEVQTREKALAQQLQSAEPDPQLVGRLMIEIKRIQEQMQRAVQESNTTLDGILTPDQRARLEHIRAAAPACGVMPAFKAAGLV